MRKIAVFGSGNGSNFEAIVNYFNKSDYDIKFCCVSDNSDAYILKRAENLGIESHYISFDKTEEFLAGNHFDLIVLAGYMRVLSSEILKQGVFLNIHPSLLPKYKGIGAIKKAYQNKDEIVGVTVHVANENLDAGPIIAQQAITIKYDLDFEEFEQKIHQIEHFLYPRVIEDILFNQSGSCCSSGGCSSSCGGCKS